jgi:hypothetical protein
MSKKHTLAQEYQQLAYALFQENLFSLEGMEMESKEGLIEEFIPKSEILEKAIETLNEFGRLMASDRRLQNEIDSGEDSSVPEETEANE